MLENETRAIPEDKYNKWLEYLNSSKAKKIRDTRLEKLILGTQAFAAILVFQITSNIMNAKRKEA